MSDPAAYAIVEGGETTFHYYRSGALSIVPVLFFGPDRAIQYIRSQDESHGLVGYAQGAIALLGDAKTLMFFGNDYAFHAELLETLLPLMQINWPGWDIRYAVDGIYDIGELLGLEFPSRQKNSTFGAYDYPFKPPQMANPPEWYACLLTVREADRVRDLGFEDGASHLLAIGPDLLNQIEGWPAADLADWKKRAELGNGVYLDCVGHHIAMFHDDEPDLTACRDVIQSRWPGWTIEIHHDGLPGQWARSGRDPAPVTLGEDIVLQQIIQLWQYSRPCNPERILRLLREQGVEFARILPDLLKFDPPGPSDETRDAMLARTIAEYRRRSISTGTTP